MLPNFMTDYAPDMSTVNSESSGNLRLSKTYGREGTDNVDVPLVELGQGAVITPSLEFLVSDIVGLCPQEEMTCTDCGIAAGRVVASVEYAEAVGNGSVHEFPSETVCAQQLVAFLIPDLPVTESVTGLRGPDPAGCRSASLVDLEPEPVFERDTANLLISNDERVTILSPSDVMLTAPPATIVGGTVATFNDALLRWRHFPTPLFGLGSKSAVASIIQP